MNPAILLPKPGTQDGKTLVGRGDSTVQVWDTSALP